MHRHLSAFLLAAIFGIAGQAFAQSFDDNASVTSPGGKKIIEDLYKGQVNYQYVDQTSPEKPVLKRDEIAAMKGGTGWGKLFQNLKAQGYYSNEYKNLGQLISYFNRLERASHANSDNLQQTSKGQIRPDRPAKPIHIERVERPSRPDRPNRPNRP